MSPLLSNVVLDELDKELEKRGLEFCRFADDCNIFVKSERAGQRVMKSLKKFVEGKLKLKLNEEKSKVAKTDKVKFLGMTIVNGTIAISLKSMKRAMERAKELTPRGSHLPIEKAIELVNKWYRGWANYHKMTQYPSQLAKIEARVRRRLRARLVRNCKRERFLYRKLMARGIGKGLAKRTAYSNRKTWALSHAPALERAYSVSWFIHRQGQFTMSDDKLKHWFRKKKWIKLT